MSDALERLKRKNRPKVTPRNTQVSSASEDIQIHRHIDDKVKTEREVAAGSGSSSPISEDIQTHRHIESQMSSPETLSDVPSDFEELEVKRSTFRLEADLIGRLHRLCQDNGISREVMIESMFEYMEQNPEASEEVMAVARAKNSYRQQVANRKRARAMIEKFG